MGFTSEAIRCSMCKAFSALGLSLRWVKDCTKISGIENCVGGLVGGIRKAEWKRKELYVEDCVSALGWLNYKTRFGVTAILVSRSIRVHVT